MRGFVAGTLVLIVLDVLVQPQVSGQVAAGGNLLVALLQRALSPSVAGVPDRSGTSGAGAGDKNAGTAVTPAVLGAYDKVAAAIKAQNGPVNVNGGPNRAQ